MMTYMDSIGYMMSCAGIDACSDTVYGGNSVTHTMTGHAYFRALGALLFMTARSPGALKGVETNHLKISFSTYIHLLLGEGAGRSKWVNRFFYVRPAPGVET